MTLQDVKDVVRPVAEVLLAAIAFLSRLDVERMRRRESSQRRAVDQLPRWTSDDSTRMPDRRKEFRRWAMLRGYVRRRWLTRAGSGPQHVKRSAQPRNTHNSRAKHK